MISEKPIPCGKCEEEKRKIESSGLFCIISCIPIDENNEICIIKWQPFKKISTPE